MLKAVCGAKAGLCLASGISGANSTPTASLAPFPFCSLQKGGKQALGSKTADELVAFLFPLTVTDDLMHPTAATAGISLQLPVWNGLPCLVNGLVLTSVTL
jgi:hypothetical protein